MPPIGIEIEDSLEQVHMETGGVSDTYMALHLYFDLLYRTENCSIQRNNAKPMGENAYSYHI